MRLDGTAPDGSPLEVHRNHGKPTRAQELARALEEARKAKKGKKSAPAQPPASTEPAEPSAVSPKARKEQALSVKSVAQTADGADSAEAPQSASSAKSAVKPAPEPAQTADGAETPPQSAKSVVRASGLEAKVPNPVRAARKAGIQVRFTGMKPMHVVEAALFAAGKPITVEEMAEQTGLPPDSVKKGIAELQAAYQERDTILEVGKAGTKWAMQVRSLAAEPAAKFAPMEIAPKLLKTLALIAFHQPMKQSQLVEMMGSKVYDHIPELVQRGLVRAREDGPTKILVTTALFPEYFGLDASDPEEIRALMGRLVGIEAPPKPKAETVYEEPQPQAPEQESPPSQAQHAT
ncbi:MAG: segregation and condensation protein [Thermoplasmata archaeon]|nr:segregation and condensation protein [Thermoplasmata archaeon]